MPAPSAQAASALSPSERRFTRDSSYGFWELTLVYRLVDDRHATRCAPIRRMNSKCSPTTQIWHSAIQCVIGPTAWVAASRLASDSDIQCTPSTSAVGCALREKATIRCPLAVSLASTCRPAGEVAPSTPTVAGSFIAHLDQCVAAAIRPGGTPACSARSAPGNRRGRVRPWRRAPRGTCRGAAQCCGQALGHLRPG